MGSYLGRKFVRIIYPVFGIGGEGLSAYVRYELQNLAGVLSQLFGDTLNIAKLAYSIESQSNNIGKNGNDNVRIFDNTYFSRHLKNHMTEEQKLEYQEIRDEYALLSQMISTTVNFSVLGSIAIFSFLGANKIPFGLFAIPLLLIYPGCFIIISRIQSILRLAAYLIVFIEPNGDIKFETRLLAIQSKRKAKLRYSKTIIWVFFGLLCINIGLFASKGYFNWWQLLCYGLSLLIYTRVYYLITKNWKKDFIEAWKEIKLSENNGG